MREQSSEAPQDVVGLGNAIVDVIAHADDVFFGAGEHGQRRDDADRIRSRRSALCPHGSGHGDLRRLGRQHHGRRRLVRRAGRIHRQGPATISSATIFAHDIRAAGVTFRTSPATDGSSDRPLPDLRHPRCAADDEHLSRRIGRAGAGGRRRGPGCHGAEVTYLEGYLWDRPAPRRPSARRRASLTAPAARSR